MQLKYGSIESTFCKWMGRLGHLIGRRPYPFIVVPFTLALALLYPCLVGFSAHQLRSHADKSRIISLFTPSGSRAAQDRETMATIFPDGGYFADRTALSPALFVFLVSAKDGGSIFRSEIVDEYARLYDEVMAIMAIDEQGNLYNYARFCEVDEVKEKCHEDYFLQIWKAKEFGLLESFTYPLIELAPTPTTEGSTPLAVAELSPFAFQNPLQSPTKRRLYIGPVLGGVLTDTNQNILYTKYVRMIINLPMVAGSNSSTELLKDFAKKFGNLSINFDSNEIDISMWSAEQYVFDMGEISRRTRRLLPYLFGSLLTFAVGSVFMRDCIRSKPWFAFSGIVSACLGIEVGFSILFLFNVELIDMAMIVPFLVLSIGVDDMFVLLSVWRKTCSCLAVPDRVRQTYAEAAVSITVTALTDAVVFAVGLFSNLPAVQIFCAYSAVTIVTVFVYQMTFLGAFLTLTGRREADKRHCLTFKISQQKESKKTVANDCPSSFGCAVSTAPKCADVFGSFDLAPKDESQPWPAIFFRDYYAPTISAKLSMKIVIGSYLLYIGFCSYLVIAETQQGLRVSNLVPYDTPTYKYLNIYETMFTKCSTFAEVVITQPLNYADVEVRNQLLEFTGTLEYTEFTFTVDFWLKEFVEFIQHSAALIQSENLLEFVKSVFLANEPFRKYEKSIKFGRNSTNGQLMIENSRFYVQLINMEVENRSKIMRFLRNRIDNTAPFPMLVYDISFPLAEQYDSILPAVLQDVLIGGFCVVIMSILLMPSALCSFCIGFTVISLNLGVLAGFGLWNVYLDIMSLLCILLSVGLSIDFSAHVTHHYLASKADTPEERIKSALHTVGWPIVQSTIATLIGVISIIAIKSYVGYIFVKTVLLVMIIGLYHGITVLPVLLLTGSRLIEFLQRKFDQKILEKEEKAYQQTMGPKIVSSLP